MLDIARGSRSVKFWGFVPYFFDILSQVQPGPWDILCFLRFRPRVRAYFRFVMYSWCDGTREFLNIEVRKRLSKMNNSSGMRVFSPFTWKIRRREDNIGAEIVGLGYKSCFELSTSLLCSNMNRSSSLALRLAFTDRNSDPQTISWHHAYGQQELSTRSRFQHYPGCGANIWNELVPASIESTGAIDAHTFRRRPDSPG